MGFFKLHGRVKLLLEYGNISIRDVVLDGWCFSIDPTIQKIHKLLIICSIIFLKLYLEISNLDVPLK